MHAPISEAGVRHVGQQLLRPRPLPSDRVDWITRSDGARKLTEVLKEVARTAPLPAASRCLLYVEDLTATEGKSVGWNQDGPVSAYRLAQYVGKKYPSIARSRTLLRLPEVVEADVKENSIAPHDPHL